MSRKRRKLKYTIFIACEGRNTEPTYFNVIKEHVEELNDNLSITIYPDENILKPKTHAIGLVKIAIEKLQDDSFNEVWAVFDKDGYTEHEEAFDLAKEKQVKIAFSSISFEHWILLHFEKNDMCFQKSDDVINYFKEKHIFQNYTKKGKDQEIPKIMTGLLNKKDVAFENAAWLKFKMQSQLGISGNRTHEINPYTNVDILVKKLFGINQNIYWANINEEAKIGNYKLIVNSVDNSIKVCFLNPIQNIVINSNNIDTIFYLLDDNDQRFNLKICNTVEIVKQPEFELYLDVNEIVAGKTFNFEIEQYRLIIQL